MITEEKPSKKDLMSRFGGKMKKPFGKKDDKKKDDKKKDKSEAVDAMVDAVLEGGKPREVLEQALKDGLAEGLPGSIAKRAQKMGGKVVQKDDTSMEIVFKDEKSSMKFTSTLDDDEYDITSSMKDGKHTVSIDEK